MKGSISTTYIIAHSREASDANQLRIICVQLKVENGVSSTHDISMAATVGLPTATVKDAKFIDDHHLMILATTSHDAKLFRVPYRSSPETAAVLTYTSWDTSSDTTRKVPETILAVNLVEDDGSSPFLCHTYQTGSMQPVKLEVNGRKGRRVICVLDANLQQYQVLDLDSGSSVLDEEADEDSSDADDGDDDLEMNQ